MIRLHGYYRSSTSYRLRIALELKGLAYEYVPVNLLESEQKGDAFTSRNPFGSVPLLEVDGKDYVQSMAQLEWLDEAYRDQPLLPADLEHRYVARELAYAIATELHAPLNLPVLKYLANEYGKSQDEIGVWYRHWLARTLDPFEAARAAGYGRLPVRRTGLLRSVPAAAGLQCPPLRLRLHRQTPHHPDRTGLPRRCPLPARASGQPTRQSRRGNKGMKLATLKDGTRDGKLVVVSKDLTRYCAADNIAPTLQHALDNWAEIAPGSKRSTPMCSTKPCRANASTSARRIRRCRAPINGPTARPTSTTSNWSARRARRSARELLSRPVDVPGRQRQLPCPARRHPLGDTKWGCDMEGEIAVITDDVPMGVSKDDAADHIKLVMLVNDVSLRGLIPSELAKGFGFFQSKPASAFSAPSAVTPDELGDAWSGSVIHLPLMVDYNGQPFGRANAGVDATFSLADLVAHAAKTRDLSAGTIIGSGTVSNQGPDGDPGKPVADGELGYSCIAEIRMIETIAKGEAKTRFMVPGDTVRVEMKDKEGHSIFGAIEQTVVEA